MGFDANFRSENQEFTPIWDSVSSHFDEILNEYLPLTDLNPSQVKRVASIGCGTFYEAAALSSRFPNAEIIGYEKDPTFVSAANKFPTFPKGAKIKEVDLGSEDGDLDGEFEIMVLRNPDIHRTEVWRKIIGKCINKLTTRGVLIVTNYVEGEGQETLPLLQGLEIKVNERNKNFWSDNSIMKTTDNYVIVAQKP